MTTTVRPRTPAELAVIVPYQLGFHPGPSVILTVLRGRRLGMIQRHDLRSDPLECAQLAEQALGIVAREGATGLVVIAFEDDEGGSAPLGDAMLAAADRHAVAVQEHVVVRGGRWFAPDCRDACCPEEGLPLPRPEDVPAVAAFVHAGVAPLPSRQDLVGGLLPERDEVRAARVRCHLEVLFGFARGRGRLLERDDRLVSAWRALLDPDPAATPVADLPDGIIATAGWSLEDVRWRDALLTSLCPGSTSVQVHQGTDADLARSVVQGCPWVPAPGAEPEDGADPTASLAAREGAEDELVRVRSRLVELTRLLPEEVAPPALTLVAHLAWWSGDGTAAGILLDRVLEIDPAYRLARLMSDLLSAGIRPWTVPPGPAGARERSGGVSGEAA